MRWSDVRKACPDQWLVIEALEAHTTPDNQRILEHIAIRGVGGREAVFLRIGLLDNAQLPHGLWLVCL